VDFFFKSTPFINDENNALYAEKRLHGHPVKSGMVFIDIRTFLRIKKPKTKVVMLKIWRWKTLKSLCNSSNKKALSIFRNYALKIFMIMFSFRETMAPTVGCWKSWDLLNKPATNHPATCTTPRLQHGLTTHRLLDNGIWLVLESRDRVSQKFVKTFQCLTSIFIMFFMFCVVWRVHCSSLQFYCVYR